LLVLDASGTDFTGGLIQSGGNQLIVHQLDTGNTLDFNAQVLGSNGFIKTGAGAMSFDKQQFFTNSSQTTINNGLLTLNSGGGQYPDGDSDQYDPDPCSPCCQRRRHARPCSAGIRHRSRRLDNSTPAAGYAAALSPTAAARRRC
jgi:hypothetical protein